MRSIIVAALLCLVVAGCSSEPVSLPVDATPASWEIQARKDADRDQALRDLKAKKLRDAEAKIEKAKAAELKRLVWEAEAPKRAELEREAAFWKKSCCEYLHELLSFKDKADFKFYGFGTAGPYTNWNKSVLALHNSDLFNSKIHKDAFELSNAAFAVWDLGFELLSGEQDSRWRSKLAQVKNVIDYDDYLRNLKK